MKVVVYGSKGWIGSQVVALLNEGNIDTITPSTRIDNLENVLNDINTHNPTHVMCLIGRTHGTIDGKLYGTIDYLEQSGKLYENIRDNLYCPLSLAFLCSQKGIHLTYFGTGCIYKYDKDHPFGQEINGFKEHDKPNFFGSSYSTVKGFTDLLMKNFTNSVLNVRLRMPITSDMSPRNMITKLLKYNKICNVPNSMTVLDDMLPIMIDMAKKKMTGSINLVNPGLISHNEILQLYKEIVDNDFIWTNFTIEEQNKILAAERSNNYLNTDKLESIYKVKNIKDSVRDIMIKIKENNQ